MVSELKLRPYITKRDLNFDDLLNSGDGGYVYYFRHGDWLIAVDADALVQQTSDQLSTEQIDTFENAESGTGKLESAA